MCNESTSTRIETTWIETTLYRNDREPSTRPYPAKIKWILFSSVSYAYSRLEVLWIPHLNQKITCMIYNSTSGFKTGFMHLKLWARSNLDSCFEPSREKHLLEPAVATTEVKNIRLIFLWATLAYIENCLQGFTVCVIIGGWVLSLKAKQLRLINCNFTAWW